MEIELAKPVDKIKASSNKIKTSSVVKICSAGLQKIEMVVVYAAICAQLYYVRLLKDRKVTTPKWPVSEEKNNIDRSDTPTLNDNVINIEDLLKDASNGLAEAQLMLGCCYYMSDSFVSDYKEALKLLYTNVQQQDQEQRYDNGELTHYRLQAIRLCHLAAEQGDAEAQKELGRLYELGIGVIRDYHESAKWFRLAGVHEMNRNYLTQRSKPINKEKFWWADRYREPWTTKVKIDVRYGQSGVESNVQNYEAAASWFRKSSDQGNLNAQYNLGVCFENGLGVTRDLREAAKCYFSAAAAGYADAQYNLGVCYANGIGVREDFAESGRWYIRAAERGHPNAMCMLGLLNEKYGDNPTNTYWYHMAAERGDAVAQRNLGVCYYDGLGVVEDLERSYYWFLLAAGNGVSIGHGKECDIAEFALSTEQIMHVQKKAKADFRRFYGPRSPYDAACPPMS